ncbi:hypothetical protein OROMI_014682 [Orobanche minor]
MWLKHHLFLNTVKESWNLYTNSSGMSKLIDKLLRLKLTLKEWNKLEFGNIHTNSDKAHYDVEVAENDFHVNPTTANSINLKKLNAILTLTLSMEEDFWRQKSNLKWMLEGERNSKFYHNIVKNNRQKNFTHSILDNGQRITDPNEINNSAVSYFANCFAENDSQLDLIDNCVIPNIICNNVNSSLCSVPTIEEIKSAVFDIDGDSVAGPDGFNANFFQNCWDIVWRDVVEAVLDFFNGNPMPRGFCTTTITLIPKNNNPQSWKDYRLQ